MKKWLLKAALQKSISFLPFSRRINYVMQRHVSRGLWLSDDFFREKIRMAKQHLASCEKLPENTLEIGTGWHPLVPLAFFLAGVDEVHTADHYPHLSRKTLQESLDFFAGPGAAILEEEGFPVKAERMEKLLEVQQMRELSTKELLGKLNIRVHLLKNGQLPGMTAGSFDLVHSNNTLAHIYDEKLVLLLREMRRMIKPEGILSHMIDLCDHFAHIDPAISVFHFLKYSDKQWRLRDNPLQAQSRNRLPDYLRLFEQAGLHVYESHCQTGRIEELQQIKLHERFRKYTTDELLVTQAHLLASPFPK